MTGPVPILWRAAGGAAVLPRRSRNILLHYYHTECVIVSQPPQPFSRGEVVFANLLPEVVASLEAAQGLTAIRRGDEVAVTVLEALPRGRASVCLATAVEVAQSARRRAQEAEEAREGS